MPGTNLTRAPERQVRSYHPAFSGELTLYSFGNDLKAWRPISARQVVWTIVLFVLAFITGQILGLGLQTWSMAWIFYYFGIPGGLGWLFARAYVEGRRLHVVLVSWVRHAFYGRHLTGGYYRTPRARPVRRTKIQVSASYRVRPRIAWGRRLVALGAIALVLLVVLTLANGATSRHVTLKGSAVAALVPPSHPAVRPVPAALPKAPPVKRRVHRKVRPVHHRPVVHHAPVVTKPSPVETTPVQQPPVQVAPVHTAPVQVAPAQTAPPVETTPAAPVQTTPAPDPAPVTSTPAPDPAPHCYLGELGC